MATTVYNVFADDVKVDSRTKKDRAVLRARDILGKKEAYVVRVETEAGTEVFKAARRKVTVFTKPYTKTIDVSDELKALVPAGYVAAYARLRNGAMVLRREDEDEIQIEVDDSRYGVIDTVAGQFAGFAATTRDAGKIMKSLGAARKTTV